MDDTLLQLLAGVSIYLLLAATAWAVVLLPFATMVVKAAARRWTRIEVEGLGVPITAIVACFAFTGFWWWEGGGAPRLPVYLFFALASTGGATTLHTVWERLKLRWAKP